MPRSRFSIALYLILVFASGILVGVVSHSLYATTTTASANSVNEFRKRYLEGMRTVVGANEQQIAEVTKILDDTKRMFDELAAREQPLHQQIQEEHIQKIRAILTDKQRVAYDNWRAERNRAQAAAKASKQ